MQLPTIRVYFTDFWDGFNPKGSRFWSVLSKRYNVVLESKHPEIVFFSCFGARHLQFDCVKVYYTGENIAPDFNLCDYAIGFHHIDFDDRYLCSPGFDAEHVCEAGTVARQQAIAGDPIQKEFCNFIYSNPAADPIRDTFFQVLSTRKHVDSLGRHLRNKKGTAAERNEGGWVASKLEMQRDYNFTIAFENSETPGYTTEKIAHAFLSGTIPIYWGDPRIADDFNPKAFIHVRDFATLEDCANYVVEVSEDIERISGYLSEPIFRNGVVPEHLRREVFDGFLYSICDQPADQRARRPRSGGHANHYIATLKREQRIPNLKYVATSKGKRVLRRFSFRKIRKLWAKLIAK